MKKIKLTKGRFTLVDDEDFENLNKFNWYCSEEKHNNYAMRRDTNTKKLVRMHRVIKQATNKNILIDHVNHDGLDNRKINLRCSTAQENLRNTTSRKGASSKYLGVFRKKVNGEKYKYVYWCAAITINHKEMYLKYFKYTDEGEVEAAKYYDEIALKHFKEYANLNFKI